MSLSGAVKEALWFRELGGDLELDLGTVQIYCNSAFELFDRFTAIEAHRRDAVPLCRERAHGAQRGRVCVLQD